MAALVVDHPHAQAAGHLRQGTLRREEAVEHHQGVDALAAQDLGQPLLDAQHGAGLVPQKLQVGNGPHGLAGFSPALDRGGHQLLQGETGHTQGQQGLRIQLGQPALDHLVLQGGSPEGELAETGPGVHPALETAALRAEGGVAAVGGHGVVIHAFAAGQGAGLAAEEDHRVTGGLQGLRQGVFPGVVDRPVLDAGEEEVHRAILAPGTGAWAQGSTAPLVCTVWVPDRGRATRVLSQAASATGAWPCRKEP